MPFFRVDPRGAYLATSANDSPTAPTRIALTALGAEAGDLLALTSLGDFKWARSPTGDDASAMIGVFVNASGQRLASDGQAIVTMPQNEGGGATDIPEDFSLGGARSFVTVPAGATAILFTAHDSYYGDNSDPDGDFGVDLSIYGPDTGLLQFDIPTRSWLLDTDGSYRFNGSFTVNGMRVSGGVRIGTDHTATIFGNATSELGDLPLFEASLSVSTTSGKGAFDAIARNLLYFGGVQYRPQGIDLSLADVRLTGGALTLPSSSFGATSLAWATDGLALRIAPATEAGTGTRFTEVTFGNATLVGDQRINFPAGLDAWIQSLTLGYRRDPNPLDSSDTDALTLRGKFGVSTLLEGALAELTLEVSDDAPLLISRGQLAAGTVAFGVDDFEAGGFEFSDAKLTGSLFDASSTVAIGIAGKVAFPSNKLFQVGNFLVNGIGAEVGITLNPFTLNTLKVEALFSDFSRVLWIAPPLAYYLKSIGAGVAHVFDPMPLTVSGKLGIKVLPILLNLALEAVISKEGLRGTLDGFLSDERVLKLDGSVQWTWAGTDRVSFDGSAKALRIEFTNPFTGGTIKVDGGVLNSSLKFTADSQFNIAVLSRGAINLPFLGEVASRDFQLQVINDGNALNDFLQTWTSIGFEFLGRKFTKSLGVRILLDGSSASVIGEDDVILFKSWIVDDTIADLTMHARWEQPATQAVVTRVLIYDDLDKTRLRAAIDEADYAAHGILRLDQIGDSRNVYVWMAQTTAGVYDLEIVDPQGLGTISFAATTSAKPIQLELGAATMSGSSLTVAYSGAAPRGLPEVRFFIDDDGEGQDGVPIGSSSTLGDASLFTWDAAGLAPGQYHLYAIAQAGNAIPVSDYSDSVITVTGQAALALSLLPAAQAVAGSDFLVTAELRNSGNTAASGAMLTVQLPAGLTLIGTSLGAAGVDAQGHHVTVGSIAAGQAVTVKLRLHSDAAGSVDIQAAVDSASWEATLEDNVASVNQSVAASGSGVPGVPGAFLVDVAVAEDQPLSVAPPVGFAPPGSLYTATLASGLPLPPWLALEAGSGILTGTPAQAQVGSTLLRLIASTPPGAVVSDTFALQVINVNDAPVAASTTVAIDEDIAHRGTLPPAVDSDGDAVDYTLATSPLHGSVQIDPGGSFYYLPAANHSGTDSFTYSVSDGNGGANTYAASIIIRSVNDAPAAADASAALLEDGALAGTLPPATDVEGDPVTYSLGRAPGKGSATVAADGRYTYAATANANGADSFTYQVTDARGASGTYTITLNIGAVNDAPVAAALGASALEDTVLDGRLPTATDADGDPVTYALAVPPGHGDARVASDGAYRYTPSANHFGADGFAFTIADGQGGSSTYTASIDVRPVNDPPAGSVTLVGTALLGQTLTAVQTLSDVEGLGPLTFTWLRDGVAIERAGSTTYKLTQADVGAVITVRAGYTDGQGTAESVTSLPTTPVAGFATVIGSAANDMLTGSPRPDSIVGLSGNDSLDGGVDDDLLLGGDGNDLLIGAAGNDTVDGGAGFDVASYRGDVPVDVDLGSGQARQGTDTDVLVAIEALIGSSAADLLAGVDGDPVRLGETFRPGGGNDTVFGGTGVDTVEFLGSRAAYEILRSTSDAERFTVTHRNGGADGIDEIAAVERFLFSDLYLAFGTRAQEVAQVAFVLWTPQIATSRDLFAKGVSYYDNGYTFDQLVEVALTYWSGESNLTLALRLMANVPDTARTLSELQAIMSRQPGDAGRAAAVKLMAEDPMNMKNIEAAGLLTQGIECTLEFGFFLPLAGP